MQNITALFFENKMVEVNQTFTLYIGLPTRGKRNMGKARGDRLAVLVSGSCGSIDMVYQVYAIRIDHRYNVNTGCFEQFANRVSIKLTIREISIRIGFYKFHKKSACNPFICVYGARIAHFVTSSSQPYNIQSISQSTCSEYFEVVGRDRQQRVWREFALVIQMYKVYQL